MVIIINVQIMVVDFVVIIIKDHNPVVNFGVIMIKDHNPAVDIEAIIEVDIHLEAEAGAEAGAEDVVSPVEVSHIVVVVVVGVVVNQIGVITIITLVVVIINKVPEVQDNTLMDINVADGQIDQYHIINRQIVILAKFGVIIIHNVNGFMMISQVYLKIIAKGNLRIMIIKIDL